MSRAVGTEGRVFGVEHNREQLAEARRQATADGEESLVEFRPGDAVDLPLSEAEWGSFDIVHTRFVLEHVVDPLAVVRSMMRAVRPGGRIVLEDDDHDVLRLSPEPPGVLELWRAYYQAYERQKKDPFVGRRLVSLLHQAGARPRGNRCLFFGSCAGSANFEAMVENFIHIIDGAREEIVGHRLADDRAVDEGLAAFREWMELPDAAMWYTTSWAEGVRPAPSVYDGLQNDSTPAVLPVCADSEDDEPSQAVAAVDAVPVTDEATLLRFLVIAAADLNSTLELDQVFHKIATRIRPLVDYHLFCIGLWNDQTQLLEHAFSMKYGKAIPQQGGFPLGYGLSGSAAALLRPIRVDDVRQDPRYVRVRHPEVEIRSELAVPLVFKDQLIGTIDLESTEQGYFTEQHEEMVSTLAAHMATALVNARLHQRVLRDEQRLERELGTAREIQHGLLPTELPVIPGVEIGASYRPARELGGDFYDLLRYADGRLAIAVGDVAGKATPAALLASMAVGLLRGHVFEHPSSPAEMLEDLNGHLQSLEADNRFVAMAYAIYDSDSRVLELANAGFPLAVFIHDGQVEQIPVRGIPLGMLPGTKYEPGSRRMSPGDLVIFCSDGLLELENARGESFSSERLVRSVQELADRPAQQVADGLTRAGVEFSAGKGRQPDDYTVVVLRFGETG